MEKSHRWAFITDSEALSQPEPTVYKQPEASCLTAVDHVPLCSLEQIPCSLEQTQSPSCGTELGLMKEISRWPSQQGQEKVS